MNKCLGYISWLAVSHPNECGDYSSYPDFIALESHGKGHRSADICAIQAVMAELEGAKQG